MTDDFLFGLAIGFMAGAVIATLFASEWLCRSDL